MQCLWLPIPVITRKPPIRCELARALLPRESASGTVVHGSFPRLLAATAIFQVAPCCSVLSTEQTSKLTAIHGTPEDTQQEWHSLLVKAGGSCVALPVVSLYSGPITNTLKTSICGCSGPWIPEFSPRS